jgi:IS30 family transposase
MSESYQHLSRDERAAIAIGLEQGLSRRAIARRLNRSPSTISREVRRTAANACIIRRGPGSVVKPGGFGRNAD